MTARRTIGHQILELANRSWVDLSPAEQGIFRDWLRSAKGHDLYMLLRVDRRRKRMSSQQMMAAVTPQQDGDG